MTTQPKRLTAEAEAMEIAIKFAKFPMGKPVYGPVWCEALSDAIAAALRQRDELYAKAWEECERWRKEAGYQRWITGNGEWAYMHPNKNDVYLIHEADAHDTLRRDAGKEKA